MIGIIMAGGKATRFGGDMEKALLELGGETLLARAAKALDTEGIGEILVAVTPSTPKTKAMAEDLGIEAIDTAGDGYHADTLKLIERFGSFVSLNVDVPFARSEHVSKLLAERSMVSLAAVVPAKIAMKQPDEDSIGIGEGGDKVIWVGLNFVTSNPRTNQFIFDDPLLSLNINTEDDLEFARDVMERLQQSA